MKVEMRKTSDIKPYARNPRKNQHAVDAVARSITEFGFRQPLVLDEHGVVIVGDTRLKAALKLGLETVPVHVASGLSETQKKAYRIADNKTAEIADWNDELLTAELEQLLKEDFDLDLLGFETAELEKLLGPEYSGNAGLCDPDAVPLPPDAAITKSGDLWLLGEHRLLCGDSAKSVDVERLVDGKVIDMIAMDPPYGVRVESRSNNSLAVGQAAHSAQALGNHQRLDLALNGGKKRATSTNLRPKDRPLVNDFLSDGDFSEMLSFWFDNAARVLKPGGSFYIWGGYANLANYPAPLKAVGLYFSQAIVWDKQWPVLTRKDFLGSFELCFYGWREGAAHWFNPEITNATDLWHVKKITPQAMIHLTEKPVELATLAMQYSSRPGENILDLFGGSGSTLIAAEMTGRRAYLMEIDELYCDVIVKRWEQFTGKQAVRA